VKYSIRLAALLLVIAAAIAPTRSGTGARAARADGGTKNPFVLGIDGMDPHLLEKFTAEGRMPHFERLMKEGSYAHLGTSVPPQSPVAWSNFITGMDPGGHGIFDFIHRNPKNYLPTFSAALVEEPKKILKLGSWRIPLSKGKVLLLRKGEAFWQILGEHDVPCTIFRIPSNFPPVESKAKAMSGMGTPDLLGTYGTFSYFTDDPSMATLDVSGGKIYPVSVRGGKAASALVGPENTMKEGKPHLEVPLVVYADKESKAAKIVVGDKQLILEVGEWSDWVEVSFPILGPLHSVKGICRFHLRSIDPYLGLYASPVNIDPAHPALPISTPPGYAASLYKKIGFYYTQGMPEDTKALEWGVLSDGEFIEQTGIVFGERLKMLDAVLDDYKGGLGFFYISTLDQSTHMLWRNMDPKHPAHTAEAARYSDALENLYTRMDSVLGVVEKRLPEGTALIIMSDHGFAPFYKKFNLNTWLLENGYIEVRRPDELERHHLLSDVDWRRTRAYGLGINGLYINLKGREKKGVVKPGREYDELLDEISRKLLAVRDPETGEPVIGRVYKTREVYHGNETANAPDLIVGYHRGYRCSDKSALGNFTREIITLNTSKWSGDHCMASDEVPGIFLSNRKIVLQNPDLTDLAATILDYYGIKKPDDMVGEPLFAH